MGSNTLSDLNAFTNYEWDQFQENIEINEHQQGMNKEENCTQSLQKQIDI